MIVKKTKLSDGYANSGKAILTSEANPKKLIGEKLFDGKVPQLNEQGGSCMFVLFTKLHRSHYRKPITLVPGGGCHYIEWYF